MNLMKNTSKVSHWFLFLVATNPQSIQPSGSSTTHTQQQLSWKFQQPKSSQEGDPQFYPFANILRTQFWCSLFLRHLFRWKRASTPLNSQPNSSMKPPQQQDKLQLWHISSQKQSSWGAPSTHWLIQHLPSTHLDYLLPFFMESQRVPLCPQ